MAQFNCPNTPATWFGCLRNADDRANTEKKLIEHYGADIRLPDFAVGDCTV
jgi:hypothetical protein